MQWYLAKAKNIVFLALRSADVPDEAAFAEFIMQLLALDSRLLAFGRLDGSNPEYCTPETVIEAARFEFVDDLDVAFRSAVDNLGAEFEDGALPWLQARAFKDRSTHEPLLFFSCPHSIMEGFDSSRLMRGQRPKPVSQNVTGSRNLAVSLVSKIAAFPIVIGHHLLARVLSPKDEDRTQYQLALDRAGVRNCARQKGMSTRDFLFAGVLGNIHFGLNTGDSVPKSAKLTYSYYASIRHSLDDTAVKLQMDFRGIKSGGDFGEFEQSFSRRLAKPPSRFLNIQHLNNGAIGLHRVIEKVFPKLYSPRVLNYVPADFLLTLLPPSRAQWPEGVLDNASLYMGCNTPGVNSCIMSPFGKTIRLALNLDAERAENLESMIEYFEEQGIKVRRNV